MPNSNNNADSATPAEMIEVPNMLRMKVGSRFGGIDPGAVAKAEAALANLSSQFSMWLQDEITKLETARAAIKSQGVTTANVNQLYVHCHDLKGLGTTYGFPLVTRIAGSICKLMDEPDKRHEAPMFLVDAHIDAIRAAVRDNICDVNHPVGKILAEELEGRVQAYLAEKTSAA